MKPMPSADENRRLAEVQIEKAAKLPTGSTKESHLKKSELCHEANAQRRLTNNRRDWIDEQG
ncbi:MAG TPA: hypothetical protein VK567_09435, partial [Bradyrhizobium sp.]|nr:hypothetical protein [Bradyrhizobium sp.]